MNVFAVLGLEVFFALQLFVLSLRRLHFFSCLRHLNTHHLSVLCVVYFFDTEYKCVVVGDAGEMLKPALFSAFQPRKLCRSSTLK